MKCNQINNLINSQIHEHEKEGNKIFNFFFKNLKIFSFGHYFSL